MDELPVIIHRLSLRLWVPEYRDRAEEPTKAETEGPGQDPLASPPQDPVDALGNALNASEIASLSLESGVETHSLFSQKSLLRLAALTDSQRTLSLFTPSIREVVYRAWTGLSEPGDGSASVASPMSPTLSRTQSNLSGSLYSLQDSASVISTQSRPSLSGHSFSGYGLSLGSGRHSKAHARKRKKRVVDLRRPKTTTTDDADSVSSGSMFPETSSAPPSVCSAPPAIMEEKSDDPVTPPLSPEDSAHLPPIYEKQRLSEPFQPVARPVRHHRGAPRDFLHETAEASSSSSSAPIRGLAENRRSAMDAEETTPRRPGPSYYASEKPEAGPSTASARHLPASIIPLMDAVPGHGAVEQAWVAKMAGEIAQRIQDEKISAGASYSGFWHHRGQEDVPPPAYGP
ncbi:hypothetical protein VTN02DRAFT_984 [Thermoascus thermophilus]